jgi:hypothetical protein
MPTGVGPAERSLDDGMDLVELILGHLRAGTDLFFRRHQRLTVLHRPPS